MVKTLRILGAVVTITALAVIVLGGYVAASGAGLGCPDWPLCHNKIIPDVTDPLVAIEFTHRLFAAFLSIITVFFVGSTWYAYRQKHSGATEKEKYLLRRIAHLSTIGLVLLLTQVNLGGVTVLSKLQPLIVAIHLGTATLFFTLMAFITYLLFNFNLYVKLMLSDHDL